MSTQKPIYHPQTTQWKLKSWVNEAKIKQSGGEILFNPHPGAVDMIMERVKRNLLQDDDIDDLDIILCSNANAPQLVEMLLEKGRTRSRYLQYIHWGELSGNENAIELLKRKNIDEAKPAGEREFHIDIKYRKGMVSIDCCDTIHWGELSANPAAIALLELHTNKIDWKRLSANPGPGVVGLLERHPDKINWKALSYNSGPGVVELLERHLDKIDWIELSANHGPGVVRLLERHLDKINWRILSANPGPGVVELLERHQDKINWRTLSSNPTAIDLL
jgi:hypothetical protein